MNCIQAHPFLKKLFLIKLYEASSSANADTYLSYSSSSSVFIGIACPFIQGQANAAAASMKESSM